MSGLEKNKIFAAVLCAGITAMLAGFVADKSVHSEELKQDAVAIEGAADNSHEGGAADAAAEGPEPILGLIASADVEKGAKISKACAACHSFEKGGAVKQGPNLWGIVGHAKGSAAGFDYSAGMKEKGGNWDYDALNHFLWKPKKFIDKTKMNFAGVKKPEDRAALIAWLRQQSDAPIALPSADAAAAEAAAPAEETTDPATAETPEAKDAPAETEKPAE